MGSNGTNTLDAVQNALVTAGVGQVTSLNSDWYIVQGYMPDSNPSENDGASGATRDRMIALYEVGGDAPLELAAIDYPRFQVKIRGGEDAYAEARNKAAEVFLALHANESILVASPESETPFVYCYATHSAPIPMGRDDRNRFSFAYNFRTMRDRQQAT